MGKKSLSHIFLIHPPMASSCMAPLSMAQTAGFLTGGSADVTVYDANLDFMTRLLTGRQSSGRLSSMTDQVEENGSVDPLQWNEKINTAGKWFNTLTSGDFYDAEKMVSTMAGINDFFTAVSRIFYPSKLGFGTFDSDFATHPMGTDPFFENNAVNPFYAFWEAALSKKIRSCTSGVVICAVISPSQTVAAITLSRYIKASFKNLHIVIMGTFPKTCHGQSMADTVFGVDQFDRLMSHLASLGWEPGRGIDPVPDFENLDPVTYMSPDPVLPFSLPKKVPGKTIDPGQTRDHIRQLKQRYSACHFFCETPIHGESLPVFLAMSGETRTKISLSVSVSENLKTDNVKKIIKGANIRQIQWDLDVKDAVDMQPLFVECAKAGIWNHLAVGGPVDESNAKKLKTILSNPNIVHSWIVDSGARENTQKKLSTPIKPLHGMPLWRIFKDPVLRFLYADRFGARAFSRMRVSEDQKSVYNLGGSLDYFYSKPDDLPDGGLDEICAMVAAGGSVSTKWVRYNLERAFLIGYVVEKGVIVGNSSLKRPRSEYIKKVHEKSGLNLEGHLERGYTSVRPEYRGMGIGTQLLSGLTKRAGDYKIFSIISEDNEATKKIALRNRTAKVATYFSEKAGKQVGVWMPEWMIGG